MTGFHALLNYLATPGRNDRPTLPPPPDEYDDEEGNDPPVPPPGPDEPHWILVVDDSRDAREFLTVLLVAEGYYVTSRSSGKAAIKHLERSYTERHVRGHRRLLPSVILLDFMMPDMNGFQFYCRMQFHEGGSRYNVNSIVVVTAFPEAAKRTLPTWIEVVAKPILDHPKFLALVARKAAEATP